jgi:hypothetical protein
MRGKEKYHSTLGIQRAQWKREWRFLGRIRARYFRWFLLRRRLRLSLTLGNYTVSPQV